jgi:hypothetical protein
MGREHRGSTSATNSDADVKLEAAYLFPNISPCSYRDRRPARLPYVTGPSVSVRVATVEAMAGIWSRMRRENPSFGSWGVLPPLEGVAETL